MYKLWSRLAVAVVVYLVVAPAVAFAGAITGKVKAENGGNVGAQIAVLGGKRPITGFCKLDGTFRIDNIPAGTYRVKFTASGYEALELANVVVTTAGETELSPKMKSAAKEFRMDDLVVRAIRENASEMELITDRKNSAVIGDGISKEMISRMPAADAGDVFKRAPSVTVQDNKFLFIRGVPDRYNATMLNGTSVTSTDTDVDKKSFSFDLVPSSLMANSVVVKTATPDLRGDFSGGLVQINTLEFPNNRLLKFSMGSSSNTYYTGERVKRGPGSDLDWIGYDNGARTFPENVSEGTPLAKSLPNNWFTNIYRIPPAQSLSAAIGDRYILGTHEIGFVLSGIYKNGFSLQNYRGTRYGFDNAEIGFEDGEEFGFNVLAGGVGNISYRPSDHHKISLQNTYTRNASETVTLSKGAQKDYDYPLEYLFEWKERELYLGQVAGEHEFPQLTGLLPWKSSFEVQWDGNRARATASEPDRRYLQYRMLQFPEVPFLQDNERTWSDLREDREGSSVNGTYELEKLGTKVKVGYSDERRDREFENKTFFADPNSVANANLIMLAEPIETIFSPDHFDGGKSNGGELFEFTRKGPFTGEYSADERIVSRYVMGDQPFNVLGQRFRVTGGLREQRFDQYIEAVQALDIPEVTAQPYGEDDILPSVNVTYYLNDKVSVRGSYFESVNYPEFRERAPIRYNDLDLDRQIVGHADLERSKIINRDVRLEIYPTPGEVLAFSFFTKDFDKPIERRLFVDDTRFRLSWRNAKNAENEGWEVEVRKKLDFVSPKLESLTINGNYTKVESKVFLNQAQNASESERPLQGQSPWSANLGLFYSNRKSGMELGVLYNKFGRRLDAVGDFSFGRGDVYEEARAVLDFTASQQLTSSTRLKLTVKDIAAKDVVFTTGGDERLEYERYKVGTSYSLSLSFDL